MRPWRWLLNDQAARRGLCAHCRRPLDADRPARDGRSLLHRGDCAEAFKTEARQW